MKINFVITKYIFATFPLLDKNSGFQNHQLSARQCIFIHYLKFVFVYE